MALRFQVSTFIPAPPETVWALLAHRPGWPEWSVRTRIDSTPDVQRVWRAVCCHRTQLPMLDTLTGMPPATYQDILGETTLYRVYSLVNAAQQDETDIFDGLHSPSSEAPNG